MKVTPDQRVFRGETVTLTCNIQKTADNIQWRYSWFKDGDTQYPVYRTTAAETRNPYRTTTTAAETRYPYRTTTTAAETRYPYRTTTTAAETRYPYRTTTTAAETRYPYRTTTTAAETRYPYRTTTTAAETRYPYRTTTAEFSFTASVSDGGEYSCRGERSDSQRSDISAAVTLTVSGE